MSQGRLTALIVAYLLVLAGLWTWIGVAGLQPRLGLDLQGGLSATLFPGEGQGEIDTDILDRTVETIRQRVDALGVAEPDIARQGTTIQVQLPGVVDEGQAREVIGRTAQLQFRAVLEELPPDPLAPSEDGEEPTGSACDERDDLSVPDPAEEVVLCERATDAAGEDLPRDQWTRLRLGPVEVSGASLSDARAELNPDSLGQVWYTALEFDREGAAAFADITGRLACNQGPTRQMAIVLDNIVEQASPMAQEIQCGVGIPGGNAVIQTNSQADARELALLLRAGALPIQLEFGTFQSISPTLGQDSLQASLIAGLIGLALLTAYFVALYRGMGVASVLEILIGLSTVVALIIVLGELVGFTLTLAGIAGIIISIGMAGDSSILYRERYRDEVRNGRTIRTAADAAFSNSFRTNLSGSIVSLLAAVVLYFLAVGPVRGFAFALGLSTLVDLIMFSTFTRGMFGLIARSPRLANASWMGLKAGVTSEQLALAATGGTGRRGRQSRGGAAKGEASKGGKSRSARSKGGRKERT